MHTVNFRINSKIYGNEQLDSHLS